MKSTLPEVGTVTVREPSDTAKSPLWVTATVTSRPAAGTGLAESVKVAAPPSVTFAPAAMVTSGGT